MSAYAALPDSVSVDYVFGTVTTFVVPAPSGCNLDCPFCYIEQRREKAIAYDLAPSDYVNFVLGVARRGSLGALCIQGYEPLRPDSFSYTREILGVGRRLGVPTSIVTNGTHLRQHVRPFPSFGLRGSP